MKVGAKRNCDKTISCKRLIQNQLQIQAKLIAKAGTWSSRRRLKAPNAPGAGINLLKYRYLS